MSGEGGKLESDEYLELREVGVIGRCMSDVAAPSEKRRRHKIIRAGNPLLIIDGFTIGDNACTATSATKLKISASILAA